MNYSRFALLHDVHRLVPMQALPLKHHKMRESLIYILSHKLPTAIVSRLAILLLAAVIPSAEPLVWMISIITTYIPNEEI